ncbi:2-oxo acid dehydrogenase subunit E2 [Pseudomonas corrugata]
MSELTSLVERARNGSLRSSELGGAGMTVTQLGDQGVDRQRIGGDLPAPGGLGRLRPYQ